MTQIRFTLPTTASDPIEFLIEDREYRITHAGPDTWLIDGHTQWLLRCHDGWYQLVPPHERPEGPVSDTDWRRLLQAIL